jgi:hypothetical protein
LAPSTLFDRRRCQPGANCSIQQPAKKLTMLGKGGVTEESMQAMAEGNARLEQGIEDLRQKYALKAEMEARQKEIDDREKRTQEALACAACVEKERLDPTVSMEMEDPDLEAVRQARMEALKSKAKALKRHIEAGGGEYREIAEDDFLKEVRAAPALNTLFFPVWRASRLARV